MKHTVLITGASGFVGKYLCIELEKQGFAVRPIYRNNIPIEHKNCGVLVQDINSKTDWSEALIGVDVVIHLAARVHVMEQLSSNGLEEYFEINALGTQNLARQAKEANVKRFIYISSIKVNGERTSGGEGFTAHDAPSPLGGYALSKREAEQRLLAAAADASMEIVIIRPPLVYGPDVKANFAKLIRLVHQGLPLPLGAIDNRRSMIFVGNLVDAIITCTVHPCAAGKTFLVCDSENVSSGQLARYLAQELGVPSRVFNMPIWLIRTFARILGKSSTIDRLIESLVVDAKDIKSQLGWTPPYTLKDGLHITAESYLRNRVRKD